MMRTKEIEDFVRKEHASLQESYNKVGEEMAETACRLKEIQWKLDTLTKFAFAWNLSLGEEESDEVEDEVQANGADKDDVKVFSSSSGSWVHLKEKPDLSTHRSFINSVLQETGKENPVTLDDLWKIRVAVSGENGESRKKGLNFQLYKMTKEGDLQRYENSEGQIVFAPNP